MAIGAMIDSRRRGLPRWSRSTRPESPSDEVRLAWMGKLRCPPRLTCCTGVFLQAFACTDMNETYVQRSVLGARCAWQSRQWRPSPRIGAEVSSPHRSLVPAIGEQIIGDDAMSDHLRLSRLREYF